MEGQIGSRVSRFVLLEYQIEEKRDWGTSVEVWTVKGGRHGEREERLLSNRLIGGGWTQLHTLEGIDSKQELLSVYIAAYPDASRKTVSNYVGQLWSLLHRMQEGDLVVLPLKTTGTVAVGRITGSYVFRDDLGEDLRHLRPVHWIDTDVPRDAFDQDLLFSFGAFLTFGKVRREHAAQRVLTAIGERAPRTPSGVEDEVLEEEDVLDVEGLAREQIRQFVSHHFAGHDLAALVGSVLEAQGFTVTVSPPGSDRGIDILGGFGPLGLDSPRIVAQIKTGQVGVDELRSLRGLVDHLRADQGLLVAWAGFRGRVKTEAKSDYFKLRLWDADDLLDAAFSVYERLSDALRSELPLQRVWTLVPPE